MQTGWNRRCRGGIIERRGWHTQTQNHLTSIPQRCSVIICWKTQFICLGRKKKEKKRMGKSPWREGVRKYSTPAPFFRSAVFRQQGTLWSLRWKNKTKKISYQQYSQRDAEFWFQSCGHIQVNGFWAYKEQLRWQGEVPSESGCPVNFLYTFILIPLGWNHLFYLLTLTWTSWVFFSNSVKCCQNRASSGWLFVLEGWEFPRQIAAVVGREYKLGQWQNKVPSPCTEFPNQREIWLLFRKIKHIIIKNIFTIMCSYSNKTPWLF